jgi:hypothetical protein
MPLDEKLLGFTNRWYQPAIEAAETREILPGVVIRVISSPYFWSLNSKTLTAEERAIIW